MSAISISRTPNCSLTIENIANTECIGDSLSKINDNFSALQTSFGNNCEALTEVISAVDNYVDVHPPVGTILMWTGQVTESSDSSIVTNAEVYIKVGGVANTSYKVCTGHGTTPDLIGRFVVGAGAPAAGSPFTSTGGTTLSKGTTGGIEEVTLTASQIPAHTHTFTPSIVTDVSKVTGSDLTGGGGTAFVQSITVTKDSTPEVDANTGGGSEHENRPPYYAVYYIMRVS